MVTWHVFLKRKTTYRLNVGFYGWLICVITIILGKTRKLGYAKICFEN